MIARQTLLTPALTPRKVNWHPAPSPPVNQPLSRQEKRVKPAARRVVTGEEAGRERAPDAAYRVDADHVESVVVAEVPLHPHHEKAQHARRGADHYRRNRPDVPRCRSYRDQAGDYAKRLCVVHAGQGQAQAHLLVRATANYPVPPGWESHPVGLEELTLAYLREPGVAALPGPTRMKNGEPTAVTR